MIWLLDTVRNELFAKFNTVTDTAVVNNNESWTLYNDNYVTEKPWSYLESDVMKVSSAQFIAVSSLVILYRPML